MNAHAVRMVLWGAAGAMALGAAILLVLGLATGVSLSDEGGDLVAGAGRGPTTQASRVPPLDDFEPIVMWNWRTGESLEPPPPPPPPSGPVSPPPPPPVRQVPVAFVGVFGSRIAVFRTSSGALVSKATGEIIDGVKFLGFENGKARVEWQGKEELLERPADTRLSGIRG